jgi:hypothetical protein
MSFQDPIKAMAFDHFLDELIYQIRKMKLPLQPFKK